jgi:DNA repair protein Swi5/Sae3
VNRSDLTPLSSNSEAHELNISTVGKSAHQNHNMSSQPPSSPKQADPPAPPSSNNTTTEEEPSKPSSTTTTSPPEPTNPRLTALEAKKATLEQTLSDLKAQRQQLATQTKLPSGLPLPTTSSSGEALTEEELLASALKSSGVVIKGHIALLHKYNEIKDIGQGLMGLIADKRDCRVVGVMEEFGVGEGD